MGKLGDEVEVECQDHETGAKLVRQAQDPSGTIGLLLTRRSDQNAARQKPKTNKENARKKDERPASLVAVLS